MSTRVHFDPPDAGRLLPCAVLAEVYSPGWRPKRREVPPGVCVIMAQWTTDAGEVVGQFARHGDLILATSLGPTLLGRALQPLPTDDGGAAFLKATEIAMTEVVWGVHAS